MIQQVKMSITVKTVPHLGMRATSYYYKQLPLFIKMKHYTSGEKYLYFPHPVVYHLSKAYLEAVTITLQKDMYRDV
jgi:hypothetical protein